MRFRLVMAKSMMAGLFLIFSGMSCNTNTAPGLFLPAGDNDAVCRTISPGDEISVRIGFRGNALKLLWTMNEASLEKIGNSEKLTLIATAPDGGFVPGDKNGRLKLIISREEGLAISDDYLDSPLATGIQKEHFDVSMSSDFSLNGIPLLSGAGTANVFDYRRATDRVTLRVSFTGPILNLVTSRLENYCGEAYFDGPVELKGF